MDHAVKIANLLYIYAECIDTGDFAGAAELFARARVTLSGDEVRQGAPQMLALWESFVRRYPNGTPMTKHVITNPIIDIADDGMSATCRSYYTVLQATPDLPLQVICAGRYHDRFARQGNEWFYTERDYSLLDHMGDMSAHMLIAPPGAV